MLDWMLEPTLGSKYGGVCFIYLFHVFFVVVVCSKEAVNFWWTSSEQRDHLAVGINYRSEQLPGASTTIHTQHAQDLQESQTPDGRGGKNIALRAGCEHWYWSDQHHHVWRKKETQGYIQDSENAAWMDNTLLCMIKIGFLAAEPLTLLCSRALTFTFRFLWLQIQFHLVSHTALK